MPALANTANQGAAGTSASDLLVASREWRRVGLVGAGRPGRPGSYRLSWSPALAEIVGDGRPWTVLMISLLSMPCR